MAEPARTPLVLVRCGWQRDRELVGQMLGMLGASARSIDDPAELQRLLVEDRIDLVLADAAGGLASLRELLQLLDDRAESAELPMVLLAPPDELTDLAVLTSRRFNAVLLTKPVAREQLAAAVESGLRFRDHQRQVRELLRRLSTANAELEIRRAAAEEEARRKTRFLAAISHDIRTPVNALVLTCQLLEMAGNGRGQTDPAEVHELIAGLRTHAASLVELVNDLLDIARYDQGKLEFHETEFSLGPFASQTLEALRPLARQKSLALTLDNASPRAVVQADRVKLARVLQNLVSNAIKFTESGEIGVTLRASTADGLRLSVRDTGIGIPPAQHESIFDEFAQLRNPERDRTKGTGLGLAICRRLVTAMDGQIRVVPEPQERGTTFLVTLPPDRVVADDRAPEATPPPASQPSHARFTGRVLIVDDHDPSRLVLQRLLQRLGLDVTVAASGREALKLLQPSQPDLVLLDLMMPDLSGLDVLRIIRQRPELDELPVVILTGDVTDQSESQLAAAGASGFLSKPLDLPKLTALLDRLEPPPAS